MNKRNGVLEWNTSLTDFTAGSLASYGAIIPFGCCILQGISIQRATLKSGISHCLIGLIPIFGLGYNRSIIRDRYLIKGTSNDDYILSLACCLSTSQEYREVEYRENRMRSSLSKSHSN